MSETENGKALDILHAAAVERVRLAMERHDPCNPESHRHMTELSLIHAAMLTDGRENFRKLFSRIEALPGMVRDQVTEALAQTPAGRPWYEIVLQRASWPAVLLVGIVYLMGAGTFWPAPWEAGK